MGCLDTPDDTEFHTAPQSGAHRQKDRLAAEHDHEAKSEISLNFSATTGKQSESTWRSKQSHHMEDKRSGPRKNKKITTEVAVQTDGLGISRGEGLPPKALPSLGEASSAASSELVRGFAHRGRLRFSGPKRRNRNVTLGTSKKLQDCFQETPHSTVQDMI